MPDRRQHRGAHPEDRKLFGQEYVPALRSAVEDLSWLLSRQYAPASALKVVGDRYSLTERQRTAVMRCACPEESKRQRQSRELAPSHVRGRPVLIDGYNVLTTVEAALGGCVVLIGRDGCYRDMASIHGTYRKVEETLPAISLAGDVLSRMGVGPCIWYLDSPVSNSGRLKSLLLEAAHRQAWDWNVQIVIDPDRALIGSGEVVASADSVILDGCSEWLNLARHIVEQVPSAWVVDLS